MGTYKKKANHFKKDFCMRKNTLGNCESLIKMNELNSSIKFQAKICIKGKKKSNYYVIIYLKHLKIDLLLFLG